MASLVPWAARAKNLDALLCACCHWRAHVVRLDDRRCEVLRGVLFACFLTSAPTPGQVSTLHRVVGLACGGGRPGCTPASWVGEIFCWFGCGEPCSSQSDVSRRQCNPTAWARMFRQQSSDSTPWSGLVSEHSVPFPICLRALQNQLDICRAFFTPPSSRVCVLLLWIVADHLDSAPVLVDGGQFWVLCCSATHRAHFHPKYW